MYLFDCFFFLNNLKQSILLLPYWGFMGPSLELILIIYLYRRSFIFTFKHVTVMDTSIAYIQVEIMGPAHWGLKK